MLVRRLTALTFAAALPITIIACSDSPKKKKPDAGQLIDTPNGNVDTPAATCNAAASYGTATLTMQGAESNGSGTMREVLYGAFLNMDTEPDALQIELYAGFGVFQSGITNGTFTLSGAELNYKTCGLCVRVFTNLHMGSQGTEITDQYFATGGTVTLTQTSGSNFVGSLSNVGLTHVTVAQDFTSTPVGDCNSSITSASINGPMTTGSAFSAPVVRGATLRGRHF